MLVFYKWEIMSPLLLSLYLNDDENDVLINGVEAIELLCLFISCNCLIFWILSFNCPFCLMYIQQLS